MAERALALPVAVDVGGVHERAAGVDERRELHRGLVLVGVPAPGHRAQGEPGHDQPAPTQRPLLHDRPTYRRTGGGTGDTRTFGAPRRGLARFPAWAGPPCSPAPRP